MITLDVVTITKSEGVSPALMGLVGAFVGGGFTVFGAWLQQRHASKESDRQFSRQRELAQEEHQRQATKELNATLSNKLDGALAFGEGAVYASQHDGGALVAMTRDQRLQAVSKIMQDYYGVSPQGVLVSPHLFEDGELRESVETYQTQARALLFLLFNGAQDGHMQKLTEAEAAVTDLRKKIDERRRQLLRSGRPL